MNTDLNLLPMLNAILQTKSVSKSSDLLGISQPAGSRLLAKLRTRLNDPVLVRTRQGYELSSFAKSINSQVKDLLFNANNIFKDRSFNPSTSSKQFKISSTDYGVICVLNPLILMLDKVAPNIEISIFPWEQNTLQTIEKGDIDFALYSDEEIPMDFYSKNLYEESYVILLKQNHKLLEKSIKSLDEEAFIDEVSRYPQIVPSYPQVDNTYIVDDVLSRMGHKEHKISTSTPYFSTLAMMIVNTNKIAIVPKRIGLEFKDLLSLELIDFPNRKNNFDYRLIWHERIHQDESFIWLKNEILKLKLDKKLSKVM